MRLRGICNSCAKRWDYLRHSPGYGRSSPKHAVSQGLLALAEDKRPGANRLIGLRPYASQRHIMACQNLHWHSISWSLIKSMRQYQIANYGEVIILSLKAFWRSNTVKMRLRRVTCQSRMFHLLKYKWVHNMSKFKLWTETTFDII